MIFGLTSLIFLIAIIMNIAGDDDAEWDFKGSFRATFSHFIKCEEENGKFYYILFGRLVSVKDHLIESRDSSYRRNLMWELNLIGSFNELRAFPKYKTKKNKRSELLEKMGI